MKSTLVSRCAAIGHRAITGRGVALSLLLASAAIAILPASAAVLPNRLRADAQLTDRTELPQGVSRRVATAQTLGRLPGDTELSTMSLVLSPSAAQSADLDQLIVAQQDPASPSYHQWLTPEQFGARFGISDTDLQTLQNWLTSQGLQVLGVSPSRNSIQFSGTAANVESAFRTNLARFHRTDQDFYENNTAPTIPVAFQGVVTAVNGFSSYRLRGDSARKQLRPAAEQGLSLSPNLTGTDSSGNVVHSLTPYDVRQIYGASALYSSGYNGTGLKIGVIGQSAVNTTQLGYFQTLTGQTVKAPTLVLVPNTGTSTIYAGDEGESEADLEYAGGVAPGATVSFVYTGSSSNANVITALEYAITSNIASILTLSYGGCEPASLSGVAGVEPYLHQANAQGQTIMTSSGDSGAAGCDNSGTAMAQDGLQVSYPASSAYVTAVGGTRLNEGTGTYWSTTNNSQLGSALSYIPEVAWNDSVQAKGLNGTGGGASALFSKPNWQTGTGVPADGARDVPDISFAASNYHDAYILCTADTGYTATGSRGQTLTGACTSTALGSFQVGGTSLSSPSFAGMLAIVQNANGTSSMGNINPSLYTLAATKPAVFHDVTSGSNIVPCLTGTQSCTTGSMGYNTTTGYDLVTGLGSMDIGQFASAIVAAKAANLKVPTVNLQQTAVSGTSITYQISVVSTSSLALPTGTVSVAVDGGTATSFPLFPGPQISSGAASYVLNTTALTAGTHTIVATYSGDANYSTATSTLKVSTIPTAGSLTVTATPVTVVQGSTGNITVSVTSGGGYSGLVVFDTIAAATGSSLPSPGCFQGRSDLAVSSGTTATMTIVFHSLASDCTNTGQNLALPSPLAEAHRRGEVPSSRATGQRSLAAMLLGCGLVGGFAARRRRWTGGLIAVAFTASLLSLNGCGSGSTPLSSTTTTGTGTTTTANTATAKGTYTVVLTAYTYPSLAAKTTANVTVTVQ